MNALSHSFLARLFDALPQSVTWTVPQYDADGRLVDFVVRYANERGGMHLGVNREDLVGKKIFTEIEMSPATRERVWTQYTQLLRDGQKVEDTFYDGHRNKYLHVVRTLVEDGILTLATDVSEAQHAADALRKQTEFANGILNGAETSILLVAPERNTEGKVTDFVIRLVNKAYARFKGKTPEEMHGQRISRIFPKAHLPVILLHYRETLLTGKPMRFDLHCDEPGKIFWVDVHVSRMSEDELLITIHDYTRLRMLQLELELKIGELERSNRNLEEFAYAASHDLKEPIRKVRFFIDRLRQQVAPPAGTEPERSFARLDVATERMRDLVDDLLAYAQVSLRPQHFDSVPLDSVLRNVLIDLELDIEQKKAIVELGNLPVVVGHLRQLHQLFQNLIGNALKYHRPGVHPKITVQATRVMGYETQALIGPEDAGRAYHLITVSDNGIGFDPEESERIFQVFQRLHGNSEYRGTGVGLSIARKVVENHHGFIYAEGRPGQGATFYLGLPATG